MGVLVKGATVTGGDTVGGCPLCEMEQADPGAIVFRDELWAAEGAPVVRAAYQRTARCAPARGGIR